ncbi:MULTISPECIES: alpha/beta fold hydrolase [unclassified Kitasatospora]|uniref:thioesterase domain-containing protein n=1 Tax=unclassified Kitasatospora TaxID=2633591 RepID=UPI0033F80F1A
MSADLLLPFGGDDTGPAPLYCVHSASGSAYTYLPLAGLLGGRPVVGIEAPGYDGDGLPPTDLRELAEDYARTVEEDCVGPELCLLGWSMGGSVAFAMAHRLLARGRRVPLVVLVDALMHHAEPVPPRQAVLSGFAVNLLTEAGNGRAEQQVADVLGEWPSDAPTGDAWRLLHRAGLIAEELDAETLDHRFEVFRRNVEALHGYRPEPGYPGPVLVVEAEDSPRGPLRWSDAAQDVRTVTVPGDHFSLWQGAGLKALGEAVRESLYEVSAARPEGVPA